VQIIGGFGETTGLRIQLLDALLPYWEVDQPPPTEGGSDAFRRPGTAG
jgi:hypothetical protein